MKNIVKVKPRANGPLFEFELENNRINIISFTVQKELGEETGWKNEGATGKIVERAKYLQGNKEHYIKGKVYKNPSVMNNIQSIFNNSDDKLRSMRKVIELFEGYNCVGSTRVEIEVDNDQMNLEEFINKYFKENNNIKIQY